MVIIRRHDVVRKRDFEVPPKLSGTEPSISELLQELEALRIRLDQAQEWFNRPQDTMKAGALAEEVKRLCQEAARSEEESEIGTLLASARELLDELQVLLGCH